MFRGAAFGFMFEGVPGAATGACVFAIMNPLMNFVSENLLGSENFLD